MNYFRFTLFEKSLFKTLTNFYVMSEDNNLQEKSVFCQKNVQFFSTLLILKERLHFLSIYVKQKETSELQLYGIKSS